MLYLVCYDIADDRRLRKVAQTMLAYGNRVQKSVFECELNVKQHREMLDKVMDIMEMGSDSVRTYPLCAACRQRRSAHGIAQVAETPTVFVV